MKDNAFTASAIAHILDYIIIGCKVIQSLGTEQGKLTLRPDNIEELHLSQ
jgi:hypothetical protein